MARNNACFSVLLFALLWCVCACSSYADVTTPRALAVGETYRLDADAHTGDEETTEPKTDLNDGLNGDSVHFRRFNVARAHLDYWYTSSYQNPGEPDPAGSQWVDYVPPLNILGPGVYSIEARYRNTDARATYDVPYTVHHQGGTTTILKCQRDGTSGSYYTVNLGTFDLGTDGWVRVEDPGSSSITLDPIRFTYLGPGDQGEGTALFEEPFTSDPFASNRWRVEKNGVAQPGTVRYFSSGGECGGYIDRYYDGHRDVIYNGAFTTAGYVDLKLRFYYKNDSGASIVAYVLRNGSWTSVATVGAASSWTLKEVSLTGTITGIYFQLIGGSNQYRRLSCISITGEPDCSPAVTITQHPAALGVCPGSPATFVVTATGASLTYQWQKNGANLTDGGDISGATTDILQIANAQTDDNGNYRCVVTGTCGTATSNAAALTVSPAPTITQQPQAQEVPLGQTAAFTVTATGTGPLGYRWQKNGFDLFDGGNISGAATRTLQIASVGGSDEGNYRCVLTDNCGTTLSGEASLTLSAVLFEDNFDANPCNRWTIYYDDWTGADCTVYFDTTNADACGGSSGFAYRCYDGNRWMVSSSFTTEGYTNPKLTFWYKNDSGAGLEAQVLRNGSWVSAKTVSSASSWTKSETSLTGTLTGLRFHFVGSTDQCRRLDCVSITGEPACSPAVTITQHPANLGVCPGSPATFTVTATGASLVYQWQKDSANLTDGGDISGATTPTLQVANAQPEDNGAYRCVVTGTCGTATSNAATLTANPQPAIAQHPQSQEECNGNTATFTVAAAGAGTLQYQWQKDTVNLSNGGDISGATAATLQIANAESADNGSYRCIVTDNCGATTSSAATLTVSSECIGVSASGHYVTYKGKPLLLIGDNGTQCVTQNANLNYRQWIDDCAARGIRSIHVWPFVPPRQTQDGSVIEDRWGYVYPGLTPWARKTSGPLAHDQLYQWNLRAFDDGPDGDFAHYWPRMRDLCAYAKSKDMIVGVTMFTGWAKHEADWVYHPLKDENGGHLVNVGDVCIIASPGSEVWQQTWSDGWSNAKKTQWVWERMAKQFVDQLNGYGNVYFTFFDEHSYSEGNMGDHFLAFFKNRGALWMDWNARRSSVDFVYSDTYSTTDKNSRAVSGFNGSPARPYFLLEGEPYMDDVVRTSIWTFAVGGGHYHFQDDCEQETVRTGIMGYDPYVPSGDKGMYKRTWIGHASRLFNEHVTELDAMSPNNSLVSSGVYCLAYPGHEYVAYSMIGSSTSFTVNLSAAGGKTLDCRFYNPRTGQFNATFQRTGGGTVSLTKPDSDDWALHIKEQPPARYALTLAVNPVSSGSIDASPAPEGDGKYAAGTVVTLTANAGTGYAFSSWSGGASGSSNPVQVTMDADKSVTANFSLLRFSLTQAVSPEGSGSIDPSPPPEGDGKYVYGTIVTLTANPGPGNTFESWSGDASGSANPTTVVMDADKSIVANFAELRYTLTLASNPSGSGSIDASPPPEGDGRYAPGTVVTLTATPADGFLFSNWSGDASGLTNPTTITMNGNKNITANFVEGRTLTLNVVNGDWGTVVVEPNLPLYAPGTAVTLTASPIEGKAFKQWEIYDPNCPGDANYAIIDANTTLTLVMDADKHVGAVFKCGSGMEPVLPLALGMLVLTVLVRRRSTR